MATQGKWEVLSTRKGQGKVVARMRRESAKLCQLSPMWQGMSKDITNKAEAEM